MDLDLRISAKPRLLRVENSRELEIQARRDGSRSTARAPSPSPGQALVAAGNETGCPQRRGLESPDRFTVLVSYVPGGGGIHRLVEARLYRDDGERRLIGRRLSVEGYLSSRLIICCDRRPLIQL